MKRAMLDQTTSIEVLRRSEDIECHNKREQGNNERL
jgi:hypothetical protein